ncbi:PEGA domain-containing protein [Geotoga petraea]|uniref:PEGA domain-containing protein n=1 Tax=Geotoga petraea TaxID=28234 RepID=A0A1G6IM07_9BACT|nr:PEGA domain-containing protein [Geotoga petraea]MDK2945297.1 hypothetical protein [Geotoga sp.]SDC07460.1 PEGA domain-containing protein [Geotoga petraea]
MKYKRLSLLFCLILFFSANFAATVNVNALNGSSVFVNGSMHEVIKNNGVELQLNDGTYTIKVSKQGYSDYTETIEISDGQNYILNVEQNPLSRIVFNNEFEISVSYKYQNEVITKELDKHSYLDLPSSVNEIEVDSSGYQKESIKLNLLPFDEKVIDLVMLKENYFILESIPSNAKVYVEDKLIGETPLELNSEYSDLITLKKEGFISKKIEYNGEKTLKVELIDGVNLTIESVPSGAAIYNGDKFLGITPLNTTVEEGNYKLKIVYTGYETKNLNIKVSEETYNNYRVVLQSELTKIELLNAENVELNIDGNFLGKGIDFIYLDNKEHLMRVKNSEKVYTFILSKNIGEYIDFKKNTFINVISKEGKTFSINSKTYYTPTTIKLTLLADTQYYTLNTVNRSYNLKLNSGNGYDIFLDNSSAIFYGSNVEDSNVYIDGKLILDEKIIPLGKKIVEVKTNFEEKTSSETIVLEENKVTIKNFNLEKTYPVRIDASNLFVINNKTYNQSPYYLYLKSGANVIEYKGIKAVIFIYGPEYINLDSLF